MPSNLQTIVVGGGIAGLAAASQLARAGIRVLVLDKGRAPGGRASTRREASFVFDHGAPFFTARELRFVEEVARWLDAGVVDRWRPRVALAQAGRLHPDPRAHEFLVGAPAMDSLAGHLARGLDVRNGVTVASIERDDGQWSVRDAEDRELARAAQVIVATPAPQAAPLLAAEAGLSARAANVPMNPCWTVMMGFAEPVPADFDAAFFGEGSLSWAVREASKPGREAAEAWVLHGSEEWSRRHAEKDPNRVVAELSAVFERYLGRLLPTPVHARAHRWRFARPEAGLGEGYLLSDGTGLAAAGDWCNGPRVENAFLSGLRLAERLLAVRSARA